MINKSNQITNINDQDYYFIQKFVNDTHATKFYAPEDRTFLYSNFYVKRNRTMKLCGKVTAFREDLVKRDYMCTVFNGLKTFLIIHTGLLTHLRNVSSFTPLTATGLAKARTKNIFFTYSDLLYHTGSSLLFRNVKLRMYRRKQHYMISSFIRQVRPLNKLLFFTYFDKLKGFSFKTPLYITIKRYKPQKFKVRYLGFKIFYKNFYKSRFSFFKRSLRVYKRPLGKVPSSRWKAFFRLKNRKYRVKRNLRQVKKRNRKLLKKRNQKWYKQRNLKYKKTVFNSKPLHRRFNLKHTSIFNYLRKKKINVLRRKDQVNIRKQKNFNRILTKFINRIQRLVANRKKRFLANQKPESLSNLLNRFKYNLKKPGLPSNCKQPRWLNAVKRLNYNVEKRINKYNHKKRINKRNAIKYALRNTIAYFQNNAKIKNRTNLLSLYHLKKNNIKTYTKLYFNRKNIVGFNRRITKHKKAKKRNKLDLFKYKKRMKSRKKSMKFDPLQESLNEETISFNQRNRVVSSKLLPIKLRTRLREFSRSFSKRKLHRYLFKLSKKKFTYQIRKKLIKKLKSKFKKKLRNKSLFKYKKRYQAFSTFIKILIRFKGKTISSLNKKILK
jgi:hypothetical protein